MKPEISDMVDVRFGEVGRVVERERSGMREIWRFKW
jgi:hypothetical protein